MFSHFDLESSMIGQKHWFYMVVTLFMLELISFGSVLYTSGVELYPTMHVGYVNFEVKHLVSLHFYNTHSFCIKSSNDIKFVGGERLLDFQTFLRPTKFQKS